MDLSAQPSTHARWGLNQKSNRRNHSSERRHTFICQCGCINEQKKKTLDMFLKIRYTYNIVKTTILYAKPANKSYGRPSSRIIRHSRHRAARDYIHRGTERRKQNCFKNIRFLNSCFRFIQKITLRLRRDPLLQAL